MIPFTMIVGDKFGDSPSKMVLADWNRRKRERPSRRIDRRGRPAPSLFTDCSLSRIQVGGL
jgi:hypothetical protein